MIILEMIHKEYAEKIVRKHQQFTLLTSPHIVATKTVYIHISVTPTPSTIQHTELAKLTATAVNIKI